MHAYAYADFRRVHDLGKLWKKRITGTHYIHKNKAEFVFGIKPRNSKF